jgi:Tfp pilus assembly protein PilO
MGSLLRNIHWFIIFYAGFQGWTAWDDHQGKISSVRDEIPVLQKNIKKGRKEKKQLTSLFKDIEAAKERIKEVALEVEKIQKQLPTEVADPEILESIRVVAENINIRNIFQTPLTEENKGFYYAKRYEFKGTGTFLQFLIFLEKIEEAERILNIRNVNISNSTQKQRGRFQLVNATIVVEAYRYNAGYREATGIGDIEKQFEADQKKKKRRKRKKKKKK